ILVTEPVGALDRVVHVPEPAVLGHVAERRADAALRGDGVRARREHLRQHAHRQAGFGELQRRTHAGATRADDQCIEAPSRELAHGRACTDWDSCADGAPHNMWTVQPAYTMSAQITMICSARRTHTGFT